MSLGVAVGRDGAARFADTAARQPGSELSRDTPRVQFQINECIGVVPIAIGQRQLGTGPGVRPNPRLAATPVVDVVGIRRGGAVTPGGERSEVPTVRDDVVVVTSAAGVSG